MVDALLRFEAVADGVWILDTHMAGEPELNAVYLLEGDQPALVEAGPAADASVITRALDAIGVGAADLAHVVVTHIHLDHAGGAGTLTRTYPHASVWVSERGARHLADPTRLVASTARTYGAERMQAYFGRTEPVSPDRIEAISDGALLHLGSRTLEVIATPGHASHHLAFADSRSGAIFTGEAIGSHLPWADVYRPALPAPEVDVDAALASIDAIRSRNASALLTSHFGVVKDSSQGCARAFERVRDWSESTKRTLRADPAATIEEVAEVLRAQATSEATLDAGRPIDMERYDAIGSIAMNAQGLVRYWRKRWEAEADEARTLS